MMNRMTTAVMQTPWDCRWSHINYPQRADREPVEHESAWICVRPTAAGNRRPVTEAECSACRYWEPFGQRGFRA